MGLIKNSSIVISGIIISSILGFLSFIYIGRALSPGEYGILGALLAFFTLLSLPATATGSVSNKFAARFSSKKEYRKIAFLRKTLAKYVIAYSAIVFLSVLIFSKFILSYLKISSLSYLILAAISFAFLMLLPPNRGILQGMKKFKTHSLSLIAESFMKLVFLIIFLNLGLRINGAIISIGLAYLFSLIFISFFIRNIKTKCEPFEIKNILNFFFIVLAISIFLQGILNLPTFFIKHYFSSEFTGYWTAALNLSKLALLFTTGISCAMFPEIAGREDKTEQKRFFKLAFILNLLSSVLIALIFLVIPEFAINMSYGANYLPALPLLRILGIAMIFFSSLQIYLSYKLASRE